MRPLLASLILLVTGCATNPGSYYTGAGEAAIKDAIPRAQAVYASGAQPKDASVKVIIKDLGTAQIGLAASHKQIDALNAKVASLEKRLHFFYWIFGIPMAIIGGLIIFKILKIFAFI